MTSDQRRTLLDRIEQAAADGLISEADRDIRLNNVRHAGSETELDLIRRDLDQLQHRQPVATAPSEPATPATNPAAKAVGANASPRRWYLLPLLLATLFVMGIALMLAYQSMRAVMDVGGTCASGGPYVSRQPCPDGSWAIGAAIPVLIVSAMVGTGIAAALRAPAVLLVMWAALFGALGWNFFDYSDRDGAGSLVLVGVMFWVMAAPAALLLIISPVLKSKLTKSGDSAATRILISWLWLLTYGIVGGLGAWAGSALWNRIG